MGNAGGDPTRKMAEANTILRATVGSEIMGLQREGHQDRDEMGICIEDLRYAQGFSEFEQFVYRTASERTGKHDAPSEPGDLDLTIYSLKKYLRLALKGNPTVLTLLFAPKEYCQVKDSRGSTLQSLAPSIISKQAGKAFLGYLEAQRQRLLGERGGRDVNRRELEASFGYDVKYAMHMLRLGFQGVELLTTGKLSFPLQSKAWSFCMATRKGEAPLQDVLTEAGNLERELKDLLHDSFLPDAPDIEKVESWMLSTYLESWKGEQEFWHHLNPSLNHHNKEA